MVIKDSYKRIIFLFSIFFSILYHDLFLRVMTREINYMSLTGVVPNMFTISWSMIIVSLIVLLPNRMKKITYSIVQVTLFIYSVGQYIYWCIFDSFFRFGDLLVAGEGADYANIITEYINFPLIMHTVITFVFLVFINKTCSKFELGEKSIGGRRYLSLLLVVVSISVIVYLPNRLGESNKNKETLTFEDFSTSRYMYDTLQTPQYAMQTVGELEYIYRDIYLSVKSKMDLNKKDEVVVEAKNKVKEYFESKELSGLNEYSNIFKDKNLILVQMESIDDWIISEKYTPTIFKMMNEGMNFTNFYTPYFGTGYTINTEYVVNTGMFPYSNGMIQYGIPHNGDYVKSLANIFRTNEYETDSFHMNTGNFYNRENLHKLFGYNEYNNSKNGFADYDSIFVNDIKDKLIKENRFFSFVISYSGHLQYSYDDLMTKELLKKYPYLKDESVNEEVNSLCIKASETDRMFKELLIALKAKNQLDETIIVAYTDHYAYGIKDEEVLKEVSGEARLEKTPFFIWGTDVNQEKIDKVCSSIDVLPTLANLFGVGDKNDYIGHDIFDENYEGFAYFKDYTYEFSDGADEVNIKSKISEMMKLNQYLLDIYTYDELETRYSK